MPFQSLTYKVLFVKPLAWWLLIWPLRAACRLHATRALFSWSGAAVRAVKTGQYLPWCWFPRLYVRLQAAASRASFASLSATSSPTIPMLDITLMKNVCSPRPVLSDVILRLWHQAESIVSIELITHGIVDVLVDGLH